MLANVKVAFLQIVYELDVVKKTTTNMLQNLVGTKLGEKRPPNSPSDTRLLSNVQLKSLSCRDQNS